MEVPTHQKEQLSTNLNWPFNCVLRCQCIFVFNKQKQQEIIVSTETKLSESERLKAELETQYYQALQDLENKEQITRS